MSVRVSRSLFSSGAICSSFALVSFLVTCCFLLFFGSFRRHWERSGGGGAPTRGEDHLCKCALPELSVRPHRRYPPQSDGGAPGPAHPGGHTAADPRGLFPPVSSPSTAWTA